MGDTELIQRYSEPIEGTILAPKIDGENKNLLEAHMLESPNATKTSVDNIFNNAYKVLQYLIDPNLDIIKLNKVLCLGKVQSGKTAFFIGAIALAFDNGYNLAFVIGGTKNRLKEQNLERLTFEFSNNPNVKVLDIADLKDNDPKALIDQGKKVIIVALKNVNSDDANLGIVENYSMYLAEYPAIVVDDEGDECSPGAPKLKIRNPRAGKTHDVIVNIFSNLKICTYLSVTATPQANLLLSTLDQLTPDFAVLVEPGDGYTGGNSFHDVLDNPHTVGIEDSDTFVTSIPESFYEAAYFYMFSILTLRSRKDFRPFSMLVHPSSYTKVQRNVLEKVEDIFYLIKDALRDENNVEYDSILGSIYSVGKDYVSDYNDFDDFKNKIAPEISDVISEIAVYEFNTSETGKKSMIEESQDKNKYKVFVGGNILGRGLTIKNLIVTYMYRDSKISQIDTLYQRARWFGYKKDYFEFCRVYMTKDLKNKFVDIVENENDMWNAFDAFLRTRINIKYFPRLFTLNNEKLRLTRQTISKTIIVDRINPGYKYDKSINLTTQDKNNNVSLYYDFFEKYKNLGEEVQFSTSSAQKGYVIKLKYSEFYEHFLKKYVFPRGSVFGPLSFEKLLNEIKNGKFEDVIRVIYMRYIDHEYRKPIVNNTAISELPQGRDDKTNYPGDKSLVPYQDMLHIQIHPVYIGKDKDDIIPVLALNNPITAFSVNYVTGDNYYEGV
ncbi:MAG: Z1 domain-containing protein [Clostridia bacterium]|nr:Z1 domain-containing protein [Clostridia bacterium]